MARALRSCPHYKDLRLNSLRTVMNDKIIIEELLHCLRIGLRNAERIGNTETIQAYKNEIAKLKKELAGLK